MGTRTIDLISVDGKTRNDIVPYYVALIRSLPCDAEVVRINQLILSKWTPRGLEYIKDKAWKEVAKERKRIAESFAKVKMN